MILKPQNGQDHMREPPVEGRIEDRVEPVGRLELAVDLAVAGRGLHPGVRRQDPGRRQQRPEGHQAAGDRRHPPAHPARPVEEDADEARLEEEGGQRLQADYRPQDRADGPGIITPVEAELEREHDAGHDPEREADGEDLAPEPEHLKVQRIAGPAVGAVADDQEDRQADRQRREGHVERRRRRELEAGQVYEGR